MTTKRGRILVADDEPMMRDLFQETLSGSWEVCLAEDGMRAKALLDHEAFDLVFLDLRMPGRDGAELLRLVRARENAPRAVLMSAHAGPERVRELLAEGADRFLEKPFDPDVIEETARQLLPGAARAVRSEAPGALVANAPSMRAVLQVVNRIAPTRVTVLLQGETGTGKEVLAREIHRLSRRSGRPFVRVNCAALAEGLLESELFGHEKGSFTGAVRTTQGLFQLADGGTLLLDEISEVSPALQAKLLRVLQEREIRRVGGASSLRVDVRVIATTNRDLAREVEEGRFRADLFHRVNVVRIEVPPLRERGEDLLPLAEGLLRRKSLEHDVPVPRLDAEARTRLGSHPWPGNVRELENVLERSLLLARDGVIRASDLALDPAARVGDEFAWDGRPLDEIERSVIAAALRRHRGNRTHAATALGISVRTIRNKLRQYRSSGSPLVEGAR